MNPWQMAQQLKHVLGRVTWGAGEEVVFGTRSVHVYAGSPTEEEIPPGFPFALITIDTGTPDPDHPALLRQRFTIVTAVEVAGDPLGEFAVIGSSRRVGLRSAGAGVAEVSSVVRSALQDLNGVDGVSIQVSGAGTGSPATMGRGRHMAVEEFTVEALCTSQPHFAAPQCLDRDGATWTFAGEHCASRFDFVRFDIGFRAGSEPPTYSEMDPEILATGTESPLTGGSKASAAIVVFAVYLGRGGGTPFSYSDPEPGSYYLT